MFELFVAIAIAASLLFGVTTPVYATTNSCILPLCPFAEVAAEKRKVKKKRSDLMIISGSGIGGDFFFRFHFF
ncbi:hypothetical protein EDD21DRAFT_390622 [Dissophora ornata]|nr:hypothetical protein EDD21DRAFT_390622 [Dissophora ornata]